jgi:hypothetical protein
MSKWGKFAEIFGVSIGQEFTMHWEDGSPAPSIYYRITQRGLQECAVEVNFHNRQSTDLEIKKWQIVDDCEIITCMLMGLLVLDRHDELYDAYSTCLE